MIGGDSSLSPSQYADDSWRDYVPRARAVIEAIREPSEAMANRGLTEWQSSTDFGALEPEAADFDLAWKAMIDALLAEGA